MSSDFVNPLARKGPSVIDCARKIKSWVRRHLILPDEVIVTVSELSCHVAGCPPRETVIVVMQQSHTAQASIHKPMVDVTEADIAIAFDQPTNSTLL